MATLAPLDCNGPVSIRVAARSRRAPTLLLPAGDGRLHAKLYQGLRAMIETGSWAPGTLLPSSRVLAKDLGLSRNTASIALEHLVAEGWAESRNRSGVFVSRRLPCAGVKPAPIKWPERSPARPVPDLPIDLFPLRAWRSAQAQLWSTHGHNLLEAPEPGGELALRETLARLICTARGFRAEAEDIIVTAQTKEAASAIAAALGNDAMSAPALDMQSGALLTGRRRRGLLDRIARGGWVVERDCEGWAIAANGRPVPPLKAESDGERLVYIRGFEGMLFPGLPLCFVIAPRPIAASLRHALAGQPLVSRADQLTFAAFVEDGHFAAHVRRLKRALPQRRAVLERLLDRRGPKTLRVLPARLPRQVLVEPRAGHAEEIGAWLRAAGLPVEYVNRHGLAEPLLLVGFSGLNEPNALAVEAQIEQTVFA